MKIAALGDLHITKQDTDSHVELFEQLNTQADVLCLCGDLTNEGKMEEAIALHRQLQYVTIPIIAVLGNHDYESGQETAVRELLESDQVHFLEGESVVIQGVGFAGIKGFGGGFDQYMLPNWGEKLFKDFVRIGVDCMLSLERAINTLETEKKVVVMHYTPTRSTLIGESPEIYPFLGLSRLQEPIDMYDVSLVFHGHAHSGTYSGQTAKGIPVFNVAEAVLKKQGIEVAMYEV